MRNTLFLLLALLLNYSAAIAQPEVSLSEPFDEPTGWNKVIQLTNGNTFYFYLTKNKLSLTVYDKNRQIQSKNDIQGKAWTARHMWASTLINIYEINHEVVIFFTKLDPTPQLLRLHFDGNTGQLTDEQVIGTVNKARRGDEPSRFYVEKDINSDCYAVVCQDNAIDNSAKRIKLTHYSDKHQEISQAYYNYTRKFKHMDLLAMLVREKQVVVGYTCYNDNKPKITDAEVITASLSAEGTEMSYARLDLAKNFNEISGIMRYNPGTKKIQLLTHIVIGEKDKSGSFFTKHRTYYYDVNTQLTFINPENMQTSQVKALEFKKVAEFTKDNMHSESAISTPQNMFINPDHSITISTEKIAHESIGESKGRSYTMLIKDAGISDFDKDGNEIGGIQLPKSQFLGLQLTYTFQHYRRQRGYNQDFNSFFSYDYVTTPSNRYVIFNDLPENFRKNPREVRKTTFTLSGESAIGHTLGKNGSKYYLFGTPSETSNTFVFIAPSHYLQSSRTYATVIIQREGRKKQSRIAWLTFK